MGYSCLTVGAGSIDWSTEAGETSTVSAFCVLVTVAQDCSAFSKLAAAPERSLDLTHFAVCSPGPLDLDEYQWHRPVSREMAC